MKVSGLDVERYQNPNAGDYSGEILVVRVHTDEDVTGTGFVSAPGRAAGLYAQVLHHVLAPAIAGEDPRLTDTLWTRMHQALPRRGGDGLVRLCSADTASGSPPMPTARITWRRTRSPSAPRSTSPTATVRSRSAAHEPT
jgi:hypothetical protein